MKAISLWQPWASLIGRGKTVETRHWKTNYRGALAIHAAQRFTLEQAQQCFSVPFATCLKHFPLRPFKGSLDLTYQLPLGAIVAVANLVDCIPTDRCFAFPDVRIRQNQRIQEGFKIYLPPAEFAFGDYRTGRYAWLLEDIQILSKPFPVHGRQGFFNVDLPAEETERNEPCGNCGAYRTATLSYVERCKNCGDEEIYLGREVGP